MRPCGARNRRSAWGSQEIGRLAKPNLRSSACDGPHQTTLDDLIPTVIGRRGVAFFLFKKTMI
jgi:hypothetical protein